MKYNYGLNSHSKYLIKLRLVNKLELWRSVTDDRSNQISLVTVLWDLGDSMTGHPKRCRVSSGSV